MHHTLEASDRALTSGYIVPGCTSASICQAPYEITRRSCAKKSGIAMQKELPFVSTCLKTVAAALTKGDWIVFKEAWAEEDDNAEADNDPIWVGRAEVNKNWNSVTKINTSRKKDGILDPGDVGVFVQWYTRKYVRKEKVGYAISTEYPKPVVTSLDTVVGAFPSTGKSQVFHQHDSSHESGHHVRRRQTSIGASWKRPTPGPHETTRVNMKITEAEAVKIKAKSIWCILRAHYDALLDREDLSTIEPHGASGE